MDDEGEKELARHEEEALPDPALSNNPEAFLNEEKKDNVKHSEEEFMGCVGTLLLIILLVPLSLFLLCLVGQR